MRRLVTYVVVGILTFTVGAAATHLSFSLRNSERRGERSPVSAVSDFPGNDEAGGEKSVNSGVFKEPVYPSVFERVETVAGTVEIIHLAPLTWHITLNGKTVLEDDESLMPDILEHVKKQIPPYDEVIVFHRMEGTYCNGGTFWFLGLKRDGSHHISQGVGQCFADFPKVGVGSVYIKVRVRGGYGNNPSPGEPYLTGGTWLFRGGRVHKVGSGKR